MLDRLKKLFGARRAQGILTPLAGASREILDRCPTGFLVVDSNSLILYSNRAATQLLDPVTGVLIGSRFTHLLTSDSTVEIDVLSGSNALTLEAQAVEIRWGETSAQLVTLRDITARRRKDFLMGARMRVLERIAQGAPLDEVLGAVVRLVESQYPASISTVMLLDEDGRHLHHGASTAFPHAMVEAFEGAEIGPRRGACGTAAYERRTVIAADIATDPLWETWRELAISQGMRACWSIPILASTDRVVGTFANYYREPHEPTSDELELASACAQITGFAIELHHAEQHLKLLQTSVANLNDLIVITEAEPVVAPGPKVVFVNDAFTRRTGYTAEEVIGNTPRILQGPLTQREELDRIRTALLAWKPVRAELINYTKSGEPFWLELDIVPIADAQGWFTHWVSVERDITEFKRAQAESQRASEVQALIVRTQREIAESVGGLHAVMTLLTERAMELTGAEGGAISLEEAGTLAYSAVAGIAMPHIGMRLTSDGNLALTSARTGEPQICNDTEVDARVDQQACRVLGVRSVICAPLVARGQVIAVLSALSVRPAAFSASDAANLQILLDSLSAAVQREQSAEHIRASEAEYRLLFNQNPHPMWVYERDSIEIKSVNTAAIKRYGYSRDEFLAMRISDLRPEEEVERLVSALQTAGPNQVHWGLWKHRLKSGELIDVEISSDDIIFDGHAARLVLANDVTQRVGAERELQRVARAQRMLSRCNEALIRTDSEQALLDMVCHIVVEEGGYRMAWVGYAMDDEAKSVVPMASAGEGVAYLVGIQISWAADDPNGQGASGRTIREGRPVVVTDLARDPAYSPWLAAAQRHGFRATCSLPLRTRSRTYGHLSMYAAEPLAVTLDEAALLQELADNLAYGIAFRRAREDRRRMNASVTRIATAISTGASGGFFEELARAMTEAVGADAGFIARFLSGEPLTARTIIAVVDGQIQDNFDYVLEGTPCETFRHEEECVVPDEVAVKFPGSASLSRLGAKAYVGRRIDGSDGKPLGLLFVIFRKHVQNADFITSTLRIFGARAMAEVERQRVEIRLREQASLLDKAQDAIVVRDLEQRITYWNKSAERIYGWRFDELRGQVNVENVYPDPSVFETIMASIHQDGEWNGRVQHRRKDGRLITVEIRATLIRDERGMPQSTFAIISDITHKLAMEERLERSERLEVIGQLTGGVAHDFNNLLTVMLGNAEMLAEELRDQPRLLMLAEMTRSAAQRGAELTHHLLAFARRQALEPKVVQVNALIKSMDSLLRRTLGGDLELELIQGAGLWNAMVDPSQLESALLNLCLNARDAMPEGGQLTLETTNSWIDQNYAGQHAEVEPGQYVLVAVSDTGCGIAPEDLPRVFEPFFTTKEMGKGTGLGLSMVYGFVKQSRGHIMIYSEPGEGTTIKMYLPRALHQAPQINPSTTPHLPQGQATILIVEDDELVRRFAEDQLRGLGYRTMTACNGPDALQMIREHAAIDLLFTDVIMPGGMNGRQLADAATVLRPALRVLFTSGYTKNAIIHRGRLDPGVHLLSKPYSRADLAQKVSAALSKESS